MVLGAEAQPRMDTTFSHYIGGEWRGSETGATVAVINPATEECEALVPVSGRNDANDAIGSARKAFDKGPWACMSRTDRARILVQLADALWRRRETISELIVRQGGATITQARGLQVDVPIQNLYLFAELAKRDPVEMSSFSGGLFDEETSLVGTTLALREPIGVVSAITGFNYPFFLNLSKLGPALAAGCSVVLKPSAEHCLDAYELARIADGETDLPKGVLNVLLGGGSDVGEIMVSHPLVDKVSFTGSTAVGRRIMELASKTIKSLTLELGGKSPNVIFADADLDRALGADGGLAIRHCGQGCSQLTRVIVESGIYDEVIHRMTNRARKVVVGDPMDTSTEMGPLASARQWQRVNHYIEVGINEGASLIWGGKRPESLPYGYYMEPTIFSDVRSEMTIAQEEIFGPVVCVIPFETESEAIDIANGTIFGLNGAVWAGDLARGLRVAGAIRSGSISVNGSGSPSSGFPSGGQKQSGLGRESGLAGYLEYTQLKTVRYSSS